MIISPYTIVDPRTMVVIYTYTLFTEFTMFGTFRFHQFTVSTYFIMAMFL